MRDRFDFGSPSMHNRTKMQKSEKFFIFSWKEVLVLGLVAITAIGFFFTLGLHYGKKMNVDSRESETPVAKLESSPESVPPKETLEQGAHHVEDTAAEAIHEATHEEMEVSKLKVEQSRPLELPARKVEVANEGSTETKTTSGRFAVQLGSYPSSKDAQKRISQYLKRGIRTEMRTALVNSETRYRVVIPGFQNLKQADQKGKELQDARKVESFVVIKSD
ncbi:MAG: SPOR domain-containing protein [Bdellovibrionales bacterium]|nr:SPOR domain-containing protein [Bdellovibrionales bacterium]